MESKDIEQLLEIRRKVDIIDKQIVPLIAQRNVLIKQAIVMKNVVKDADDVDRVSVVLQNVKALAGEFQLEEAVIEKIYRTMMNAFIDQGASHIDPVYREMKKSYY
ncbi:MAG: chorismate mutase [Dysgonomonas sp.]